MSNLAAVVLAAGRSTRFRSKLPKLLHPIAGRAMIDYVLEAVAGAGVSRVVAVVGADSTQLRAAVGDAVAFAVQAEPLGEVTLKGIAHPVPVFNITAFKQ